VQERRIDLHVASSFLHRAFGLFLEKLWRIIRPSWTEGLSDVNFERILGPYLVWFLPWLWKMGRPKTNAWYESTVILEGARVILLGCREIHRHRLILVFLSAFGRHRTLLFRGLLSAVSSRTWIIAFSLRSWFSSPTSWIVNCYSKRSSVALALSIQWMMRPEGPWIVVNALGPSHFKRDFWIDQVVGGVTSQFPVSVPHRSRAFLLITLLIVLVTQLSTDLRAVSVVSLHTPRSLCLLLIDLNWIVPYVNPKECLLVAIQYVIAIQSVKYRSALSDSSTESIGFLGRLIQRQCYEITPYLCIFELGPKYF
jgi:hypothetical protein